MVSLSSGSLSLKALALGEVEVLGLAILTSSYLADPFGSEHMDFLVTDNRSSLFCCFKGDEPVSFIGIGSLGLKREQRVSDFSELTEVLLEFFSLANQLGPDQEFLPRRSS